MYTSYSLTKSIFKAVLDYEQDDLADIIYEADPAVLADEIFNIFVILFTLLDSDQRKELEHRLFSESVAYDFATLTKNLQNRFVFKTQEKE